MWKMHLSSYISKILLFSVSLDIIIVAIHNKRRATYTFFNSKNPEPFYLAPLLVAILNSFRMLWIQNCHMKEELFLPFTCTACTICDRSRWRSNLIFLVCLKRCGSHSGQKRKLLGDPGVPSQLILAANHPPVPQDSATLLMPFDVTAKP